MIQQSGRSKLGAKRSHIYITVYMAEAERPRDVHAVS